ncbi:MAG: type I DNA topoisomerase [SAR202 cluster bacterium]|nr:type I DNA topoisomerase [SAR202 cluster bacterium]
MAKNLVIVESPAKAKTVGRFLGNGYTAKASMGHVRDLPKDKLSVDVEDGSFKPKYGVLPDRRKVVTELAEASKDAETVFLATDPDREGEAISWHLLYAAHIDQKKTKRVVFHEITQEAIREAFANPRELDTRLINAQQARRILDRLVGYQLSPVLWKKVRRGLSAGRVQSVALRLIVERHQEHIQFVPKEYWTIEALLAKGQEDDKQARFEAKLFGLRGDKRAVEIPNDTHAGQLIADLEGAAYRVESVQTRETHSRPSAPFITSTLQQEAWRKLHFSARRTMLIAQQLYEGLPLGDEGSVGLITYMRTDSTNVAHSAVNEARHFIQRTYGTQYVPHTPRFYTRKVKGAQEAHEAIRPTSMERQPAVVRRFLTDDQAKLYELIWKRMLASQMPDALFDATNAEIQAHSAKSNKDYAFRASGSVLKFPGFRAVYMESLDEAENGQANGEEGGPLPPLVQGDVLACLGLNKEQHFTQPPPLYTEATLVKALEEKGIGRPSTYATIIATITDRDYVNKDKGRFVPTKLGIAVNGLLTAHFPEVMDIGFTARIEEELDDIAAGEREWQPVLKEFYDPFHRSVGKAMTEAQRVPRDQIDEQTDEVCEKCERPMVIKSGRFGRFLSCSGFPECRNSKPLMMRTGVECPEDGGELVQRRQRGKGKTFYGCANYPNCKFAVNTKPLPMPCPECGKLLVASGKENARCTACQYKGPIPEAEPAVAAV